MTLVYFAGDRCCGSFHSWLNISPFAAAGRSAVGSVAGVFLVCRPWLLLCSPFPWGCGQMWLEVTSDVNTPNPALVLPRVVDVARGS